jgi:hypothetical protein
MAITDGTVFWELIEELQLDAPRIEDGAFVEGRCTVGFKGRGLVVRPPAAGLSGRSGGRR